MAVQMWLKSSLPDERLAQRAGTFMCYEQSTEIMLV